MYYKEPIYSFPNDVSVVREYKIFFIASILFLKINKAYVLS